MSQVLVLILVLASLVLVLVLVGLVPVLVLVLACPVLINITDLFRPQCGSGQPTHRQAYGRNISRRMVVARSNCSRIGVERRSNRSRIAVVIAALARNDNDDR